MNEDKNNKSSSAEEDKRLVLDFRSGETDSFDKLVIKYHGKVFNICFRFLGDYQDADDVSQEIFLKAYRSLDRFRLESSFFTWLYRITVNTCKNKLKSLEYRYNKRTLKTDYTEDQNGPLKTLDIKDNKLSPYDALSNKEMMRAIKQAIDTLPPEQKTVVVLRDIEGLTYEEIKDVTDFKLGTIKSRLARARMDLREKLREIL